MGSWHRMQGNAACGTYSVRCCYSADELIWGRTRVTSRGSTVQDIQRRAPARAARLITGPRSLGCLCSGSQPPPKHTHTRHLHGVHQLPPDRPHRLSPDTQIVQQPMDGGEGVAAHRRHQLPAEVGRKTRREVCKTVGRWAWSDAVGCPLTKQGTQHLPVTESMV